MPKSKFVPEWKFTACLEDFADEKMKAIHNFIDAYAAQTDLFALEDKAPDKVTAQMMQEASDKVDDALNILIEAEFACRAARRRRQAE
jgi:hypothetical protein